VATRDLKAVGRGADRVDAAYLELAWRILRAADSGETIADIARHARLRQRRVRELLEQARDDQQRLAGDR
jgi:hypothetical protein